jgi:peptide/nickel transport system substrate-binding protein
MFKKASLVIAGIMILALVLSACGATPEPQVVEKTIKETVVVEQTVKETVIVEGTPQVVEKVVTATPEPIVSKGTVVVGEWQEPKGLIYQIFQQAHTTAIVRSIYYQPLTLNGNDALEAEMLEEVPTLQNGAISPDGLTMTLKFKDGFKWHDGVPVTAEDFKFTWQFTVDPNSKAMTTQGWQEIDSIDVPDPLTAVIHFKQPYVSFAEVNLLQPLMPKHLLEGVADPAASDYARKPVGNGPFIFQEWVPGDHITVVANPDAPIPPKLEKIIFKFVPDLNTLLALLRVGDIDVAWDMTSDQIDEIKTMSDVSLITIDGVGCERWYFNLRDPKDLTKPHPLFADINVRKAIILGMDRFTFVNSVLKGYGAVAISEMDNTPFFNKNLQPYPYDPEQAKQILDAAGWVDSNGDGIREKDGVRMSFKVSVTAGNAVRENSEVFFQSNLKDIGVEMIIENYPSATLFGTCADNGVWGTSNYDVMGFGLKASSLDWPGNLPRYFSISEIRDCQTNPAGSNSYGFNYPPIEPSLQCIKTEIDAEKRLACINEAQQMLYDQYVPIYLWDRIDIYAVNKRVGGIQPTPFGAHDWNYKDWFVNE